MILRSFGLTLLAILGWQSAVQSQAYKYSNEFLAIGVGARALSMSNSVVGSVDDVTAAYWNPAGLTGVNTDLQLGLMHAEYFAGIAKYDYGGLAFRLDSASVLGVSILRFGVDNIPNTTELIDAQGNIDYDRITEFSAADYAFLFSYARKMKVPGLHVGGNFKIIHRKVGDFGKAWGFGVDAAARYNHQGWLLGAVLRDATSTFNAWSYSLSDQMINTFLVTGNEIPDNTLEITLPRLLLGGGRKFNFNDKFSLLTELDLDLTFDGKRNTLIRSKAMSIDPHFGFEGGFKNIVFLRGGVGNVQSSTDIFGKTIWTLQPNLGIGLRIKSFALDYALTDIGDQSVALYSHIFSLKIDINKTKTE